MEIENKYKYYAFISYKREDERWAKWLQHKLEHYKLPSNLNGRTDLPKEIRPIFRDQSDLAGGVLADEINDALEHSKFLIVICSPRAAQSEWVGKEVQAFMDMGRADMIIPFIIGGTVNAQNSQEECFPLALRKLPPHRELLGVNINEFGQDAAAVKVVAQMFGLKFDELWQRFEREQKKKRNLIIVVIVMGFLVMAGIAGWIWQQNIIIEQQNADIRDKNWKMMENQARFVAEKAQHLIDEGDCDLAQRLLIEVIPKDTEKPLVVEASNALGDAIRRNYTVLTKHTDEMCSAVYSPDGKYIATSSMDGKIIIWDAKTKEVLKQYEHVYGNCWPYLVVKYSPNGEQIVSATMAHEPNLIFWDVETDTIIKRLKGYNAWYSPDGKYVAIELSRGNVINVFDADNWRCVSTIECYDGFITSIAFSPDGKYMATASLKKLFGEVVIWDIKTGQKVQELDGYDVSYSPDGNYLAICRWQGIIVWNVDMNTVDWKGIQIAGYTDNSNPFVDFSPDSKQIISATGDNSIIIWNVGTGEIIKRLKGHKGNIVSASYSPDGRYIVSTSKDSTVRIWDTSVDDELEIHSLDGNVLKAETMSYSPDGIKIVSRFEDNTIRICNAKTCTEIMTLDGLIDSDYCETCFPVYSPNGRNIVAIDNQFIKIWDSETGKITNQFYDGYKYESASYSPDCAHIASTSGNRITIWDSKTGKKTKTIVGHGRCYHNTIFSPDNQRLAITVDSLIIIRDAKKRRTYKTLQGHSDDVNALSYSPDGHYLISASKDRTVRIWDIDAGVELNKMDNFKGDLLSVCYSFDGKYIMSESLDDTLDFSIDLNSNVINNIIRVWDAETYQEIMWFKSITNIGFFQKCSCATFSPDGNSIVYINNRGGYSSRPLITILIDQTRERFKDSPLTPEERRMYYLE